LAEGCSYVPKSDPRGCEMKDAFSHEWEKGEASVLCLPGDEDDHLGSTSIAYDGTMKGQGYKAWGERRFIVGGEELPTTFRYTGQREEAAIGLYYYGARWYDPVLGRWIQPDSIIPKSRNVQAFDRYAYALNNPLKYNDPSGHWIDTAIDVISLAYDVYEISQEGLDWQNGLALAADVVCFALPAITGGGLIVRVITHADDAADAAKATSRIVSLSDEAIKLGRELVEKLPNELHYMVSSINKEWTPIFEKIIAKYGKLDDLWKRVDMPHKGRHPNAYHEWIADALQEIDRIANGNYNEFRRLFEKYIVKVVEENPWILKSSWWKKYGDEWWECWDELVEEGLD